MGDFPKFGKICKRQVMYLTDLLQYEKKTAPYHLNKLLYRTIIVLWFPVS